ncbi:MAG: D-alanyl-D-alanine carboxypeptidase/D-alanyl-D-alanine-endopeptidase [Leptolyngbya sp. SIO4C1]|nr:D-alanyl-D-alanine carboxypeptidase/D-alanyl-D-alanine-endopeptidase [Leptolyngbya sp. SIO4C1]
MRRSHLLRWLPALLVTFALPAQAVCRAELAAQIDAIAARPELDRARLGVLVETLARSATERQTLYARDPDRYFVPASNVKLLTTAAALQQLGPDFTTRTSVYGRAQDGLTTLHVVGRGDPSFGESQMSAIAQQLQQQGIQRVSNLLGYDSYFTGSVVNPNWEWEDVQAGYGAPVNSLIFKENELGLTLFPQQVGQPLRVAWDNPMQAAQWQIENFSTTVAANQPEFVEVGRDLSQPVLRVYGQLIAGAAPETASIAVPEPGRQFLEALQQRLMQLAIPVAQTNLSSQPLSNGMTELAAVTSSPLSAWVERANRHSNNLYAEALLKSLGRAHDADAPATAAGIAAVEASLQPLGVAPDSYALADGSGLSRHNLATPATFVDTLQAMAFAPQQAPYRRSLAVAGESGTLRNRFRNTPVQGRLQGKTGAVSNNAALSGYLSPPQHPPVVLSILLNHVDQRGSILRQIIDEIVLQIAQLEDC